MNPAEGVSPPVDFADLANVMSEDGDLPLNLKPPDTMAYYSHLYPAMRHWWWNPSMQQHILEVGAPPDKDGYWERNYKAVRSCPAPMHIGGLQHYLSHTHLNSAKCNI